jgi:hypothetical protein
VLYHLSHTPSPFYLRVFSNRVLHFFSWAGLRPRSSYLCVPCS